MGTIISRLSRPIKNWNVENRAHKAISREKPKPAPTYDTTYKQIKIATKINPRYLEEASQKDPKLNNHLKEVYVSSNTLEIKEIDSRSNPDRPLPTEKLLQEPFEYGFYQPEQTSPGKLTLIQALQLLGKHSKDPQKFTIEALADHYKLEPEVVANILEHFKLFEVIEIKQDEYNRDLVARKIPVSQRSGIRVLFTEKKKKSEWFAKKPPKEELPEDKHMKEELPAEKSVGRIKEK